MKTLHNPVLRFLFGAMALLSTSAQAQMVTNVTQGTAQLTLQDALDNAVSGDAIEIAAGTLTEDGIMFPVGLEVTITGAGKDVTFIDGGTDGSDGEAILRFVTSGQTSATVISDLTLLNGADTTPTDQGSLKVIDTSPTFRDVAFRDATGNGAVAGLRIANSASTFERCEITGMSGGNMAVLVSGNSNVLFLQCLFADNLTTSRIIQSQAKGHVTYINCTIDSMNDAIDLNSIIGTVTNTVIVGTLEETSNVVFDRSLFAGATGTNINGVPDYVDVTSGDYRLAAGSLGIDAADMDAYLAEGGGLVDLAAADRTNNDSNTPDTGSGLFTHLDMGAYEFQGTSPAACPADFTSEGDGPPDGIVGIVEFLRILADWGACP